MPQGTDQDRRTVRASALINAILISLMKRAGDGARVVRLDDAPPHGWIHGPENETCTLGELLDELASRCGGLGPAARTPCGLIRDEIEKEPE